MAAMLTSTPKAAKHEMSAESRSTSAGSGESGRQQHRNSENNSSSSAKLPEYEYPVPVMVRNTFIEAPVGRPASLEGFYMERRVHSCPVVQNNYECEDEPPVRQPLHRAITLGAEALMAKLADATGFWADVPVSASETQCASREAPQVLMLSEMLQEPQLGSQELPTVGSAGHHSGTCKPCAFLHTRGCENGTQCTFCHLCPPDEKRNRRKQKQAAFREMRQRRRQVCF